MKESWKNNNPVNWILKQYAVSLLLFLPFLSYAHIDTAVAKLQDKYQSAQSDSSRAVALKDICWYYRYINLDSAVSYGKKSIALSQKTSSKRLEGDVKRFIGIAYWHYAYEEECLEWIYASLKIAEEIGDKSGEAYCYDNIGNTFFSQGFYEKALENFSKAKEIFTQIKDDKGIAYTLLHSSWVYAGKKDFNTALDYIHKAVELRRKIGDSLLVSVP
jgi:tetratricopeptide (TPR) repeat protein